MSLMFDSLNRYVDIIPEEAFIFLSLGVYVYVLLFIFRKKVVRINWKPIEGQKDKAKTLVENINSVKNTYNFWLYVNIVSFAVALFWVWDDSNLPLDGQDLIRHIPRYLVVGGYFSFITVQLGRYYKFFVENVNIKS